MKTIDCKNLGFAELNSLIREENEVELVNCAGQRFIGAGTENKRIVIKGVPGNGLASFMSGGEITVFGNVQDQVCDTMNDGKVIVHGLAGDASGYAMRGGEIYIEGKAGYRTGIHMKEYGDKKPVIVIGETSGSFLGEYQAGGLIVVLNSENSSKPVGFFCGTGMHGGKIVIRTETEPQNVSPKINVKIAEKEDLAEIEKYVSEFCKYFSRNKKEYMKSRFYVLAPDSKNPYKELYVHN